jgi:nucleotide-binding universal stress UspA family protein
MRAIVVGVDEHQHSIAAARFAARLARTSEASLTVVFVCQPPRAWGPSPSAGFILAAYVDDLARAVRQQVDPVLAAEGVGFEFLSRTGDPVIELAGIAAARAADLIVVGRRRRGGLRGRRAGSVAAGLVRLAGCPVTVVPEPPRDQSGRRVAGSAGQDEALAAMEQSLVASLTPVERLELARLLRRFTGPPSRSGGGPGPVDDPGQP